jgi:hypothetical protein
MIDDPDRHAEMIAAIDARGADLSRWSDRALANRVREAALADRAVRAHLDETLRLERELAAARDALDAGIRSSGAVERVRAAVLTRQRRPPRRAGWMAIAAALVLAAGIGGAIDGGRLIRGTTQNPDVVVLDPLVFGTLESDNE